MIYKLILDKKSNTCFQGDSERVELVGGAKIKEIFLNTYAPAIHNFDILKVVDDKVSCNTKLISRP